jgi:hypothetical protein
MRHNCALWAILLSTSGVGVFAACSEEAAPSYGPPEQPGQTVMLPVPGGTAAQPSTDGGAPVDGGAVTECDADASGCSVSWTKTLFPNLTGALGCSHSGCHAPGAVPPTVIDADPAGTYSALAAFTATAPAGSPYGGEPFLEPCSSDPTRSTFLCSLSTPGCGTPMPLPTYGAQPLGDADLQSVAAWIACGAPYN